MHARRCDGQNGLQNSHVEQQEPQLADVIQKPFTPQPPEVLAVPNAQLKMRTLVALTGRSRSTIYALIGKGEFPPPLRDGGSRCSRWLASDVSRWLDARAKAGTQPAEVE
jgi:prophage regulatory protein